MHKAENRILTVLAIFLFFTAIELIPAHYLCGPGLTERIPVTVRKNASEKDILRDLSNAGLINNTISAALLIRAGRKKMKFGDYEMSFRQSLYETVEILAMGRTVVNTVKIVLYEGMRRDQIARKLKNNGVLNSTEEFYRLEKKIVSDKALCERYLIKYPSENLEGYIYPDTYLFYKNEEPGAVLHKMLDRFRQVVLRFAAPDKADELHDHIIIASLIEKETGRNEEALISSVIYNRLKIRMKLQLDVTILYALRRDNIVTMNITAQNKYYDSPYNTYMHYGLPPGPICNPGLKAIEAAYAPASSAYLYYVSKNDGTHIFSTNYKDHRLNVRLYQMRR